LFGASTPSENLVPDSGEGFLSFLKIFIKKLAKCLVVSKKSSTFASLMQHTDKEEALRKRKTQHF
jgi:hypothetical protein